MEIKLVYQVPVIVTVDLKEHDVTQVVVFDEASSVWESAETATYGRVKGGQARRAMEIADQAMWPRWQFGF